MNDDATHYANPTNRAERLPYAQPTIVHRGVRNPGTGWIGGWSTPTRFLHTLCSAAWADPYRPRRTLMAELVTCAECKARQEREKVIDER